MKKLFTIDDFMIAFISALGYGYSETIAKLSGWPMHMCLVASLIIGLVIEEIISNISFSEAVQKKPKNRVILYVVFFLIFLIGHYISATWMGTSMLDYLIEEFEYVVGLPILGFVLNLLIRAYRIKKIRKVYGDGSKGYVFDVDKEDVDELNEQNRQISGEYDSDLAVKTRTGIYVGYKQDGLILYLGIPYAKPPVGELRWKAPEPLPSSDAVFEAENPGASAIQVEYAGVILKHHRQSEDCLYLNIFTANQKTEQKKPVLVLFSHGSFTYGGAADPLLYGNEFIKEHEDVILVSFNFRLGIFGFIDFSEIPGGEAYPDALNLGLLDQIAALEWIKENIAAFGGDPERITVIGFESGATSICLLAATGQAKELFWKAFAFYGSLETVYSTPDASRALARDLLKETQTTTMEELLGLKTEDLKAATQRLWHDLSAPTCDGRLIPSDVNRAFQEGAASDIEFIIGIPSKEMPVFRSFVGNKNYETFILSALKEIKTAVASYDNDAIQELLDSQLSSATDLETKTEIVEHWMAISVYQSALKLSQGGNKVHLMYWDEKPLIDKLGSGTVNVAAALLGNSDASQMYGSVMNDDLSEILQTLLYKFINGDELQLYNNEIEYVNAMTWKPFPQALIISDGKIIFDRIEDKLTDEKEVLDFLVK